MTWWIDGIKDDRQLALALREEADQAITVSEHDLLVYAADRIDALVQENQKLSAAKQ